MSDAPSFTPIALNRHSAAQSESSAAYASTTAHPVDVRAFPKQVQWVLGLLTRANQGGLQLTFPDGQRAFFGRAHSPLQADVQLANWKVFGAALSSGDIGFAETYAAGDWSSSDPQRVLQFFVRNRADVERVIYGSFWGSLLYRVKHLFNRNSKPQAKKNISAHYDLGNAFYALWLDPSMTYSSALFTEADVVDCHQPASTALLVRAQQAKYARVLDQLQLTPHSSVLEIGCGWGGLAEAAARAGHAIRGLTLSHEQHSYAKNRLSRAGLAGEFQLQDYRDENGCYDGIASIEMFEAVGEAYWPSFFSSVQRCLKPGARACIQTIVINETLFERYRRSTDFIQQYIFPGGMLPSPRAFEEQAQRAGLKVVERFTFGKHYARTLASWRAQFMAQLEAVRALGFDDRFCKLWEFYLAYCEAAFAEGNTDVVQYTLQRPLHPGA